MILDTEDTRETEGYRDGRRQQSGAAAPTLGAWSRADPRIARLASRQSDLTQADVSGSKEGHRPRSPPQAPKPPRKPRRRWLWGALGRLSVATIAVTAIFFAWALRDLPLRQISESSPAPVVMLAAAGGEALPHITPFRASYVEKEDFPQHLIDAVLVAEDKRFFGHVGFDPLAIVRALIANISAGYVVQGASTITQQLARIDYLSTDRTLKRKIQEAAIALWLEWSFSKDEILTRYLNSIFLGAANGVPSAARVYFGKDVRQLTLAESAMIAGLIRSPSRLSPFTDLRGTRERAGEVLDAMADAGVIDATERVVAKAELTTIRPTPFQASGSWFTDWLLEDSRMLAGGLEGTIRIRTTLDARLQELAQAAVNETLAKLGAQHGASQAALVAMRPDGAVVAMVGGRDYQESQFNRAVSAMRQPGSAFKLFVYHAALRAGVPLDSTLLDAPIAVGRWRPRNFGHRYRGRVSLQDAFAGSLNMPAVALAQEVGIQRVIESARELGIDADLAARPSLALGTSEVSLLDLTGAFASVRAGVTPIEPYGLASFTIDGQSRSFNVGPPRSPTRNLPEQQQLFTLLRRVVEHGTGRAANFSPLAAGKTGTSQGFRDAWFIGFAGPLVAGVWVGNDDNSPMHDVTGGELPARIWRRFMEAATIDPQQPDTTAVTSSIAPDQGSGAQEGLRTGGQGGPLGAGVTAGAAGDAGILTGTGEPSQAPMTCNVRVCSSFYRSFRAADCTFQPYGGGPRRLCER